MGYSHTVHVFFKDSKKRHHARYRVRVELASYKRCLYSENYFWFHLMIIHETKRKKKFTVICFLLHVLMALRSEGNKKALSIMEVIVPWGDF